VPYAHVHADDHRSKSDDGHHQHLAAEHGQSCNDRTPDYNGGAGYQF
jgi:hypothetical protein